MDAGNHQVIAIDGPAASGKSSVARAVAARLQFIYVNSGSLYRAVTHLSLQLENAPPQEAHIMEALEEGRLQCGLEKSALIVSVDGVGLSSQLSSHEVNHRVSEISALPEIRRWLLQRLRSFATEGNLVMEGRDIGSVVFPDTPYKFYLDASPEVREQRRKAQGIGDTILQRDQMDSSRKTAPLTLAPDATVIDSSHLDLAQTVDSILLHLKKKGLQE